MALSESPRGWWLGSVTTPTTGYPMLQKFAPRLLGIAGAATCALALSACQDQASSGGGARSYISAVGSSTVYPFATAVGEKFAEATGNQTPDRKSTRLNSRH